MMNDRPQPPSDPPPDPPQRATVDYDAIRRAIAGPRQDPACATPGLGRAAVCLTLFDDPDTRILAIRKADQPGYHWRNQIALPGGHIEPLDPSPRDAALRELEEELGIPRSGVHVLGELGHFQTVTSAMDLQVFVVRRVGRSPIRSDPREVAGVLRVPLAQLIAHHRQAGFTERDVSDIADALVYPVHGTEIWGVTARILHAFLERLRHADCFH